MNRRLAPVHALLAGVVVHGLACLGPNVTGGARLALAQPAQPGPIPGLVALPDAQQAEADGLLFPVQRTAARKLQQARTCIDEGHYGEAAFLLDAILQEEQDSFVSRQDGISGYRSLKLEALQLLDRLPPNGREAYGLQFGAQARKKLEQAVAAGDLSAVFDVSRRYFHTQAGREATLLGGYSHLDHGQPLAAALCFEQLIGCTDAATLEPTLSVLTAYSWRRAGCDDRARRTLHELKRRNPHAQLQIAGQEQPLFSSDATALTWLDDTVGRQRPVKPDAAADWTTFRGNVARNAPSDGGRPLLTARWQIRMAHYPVVENVLRQMQRAYTAFGVVALPGVHPLAVGNLVVARTTRSLVAIDFRTGKRIWEVSPEPDDPFEGLIHAARSAGPRSSPFALGLGLQYRLWEDTTFGTLSSDGTRVFVVEGLGFLPGLSSHQRLTMQMRGRGESAEQTPAAAGWLAAFYLYRNGQTAWKVGGPDSVEPELADAVFLGAPLVHEGALHALVEVKSGIRLVTLDAATGRLQWSQQLVDLERSIHQDPVRRLAGATPSLADGIAVCPTSAGAAIAVDLTRRCLLWVHQYPPVTRPQTNRLAPFVDDTAGNVSRSTSRWADPTVTLADGRALLTPVESDHLYCLSLVDGSLLWKRPRGDDLLVACVHAGNVFLVGAGSVTALGLADGAPAWPQPVALPDGSWPSGRGYLSDGAYYLPLSSAEVVQIDLKEGRIVTRTRSRTGDVPGNLICHRDQVISQGVDYLQTYYQMEPLRARVDAALAKRPDDAEALARRGEIARDEDRLGEAVDWLRKSFAADPNPLTRELLVQSLLEMLRLDFSGSRDLVAQLGELIERPRQQAELLRLVARGYQEAGATMAAFGAHMELLDMADVPAELLQISPALAVRGDRWIRARLSALRRAAAAADCARIDSQIEARLHALLGRDAAVDEMRWFLAVFADHAAADTMRLRLARKLLADDALLECEAHLRTLERSAHDPARQAAVALMAQLLRKAGKQPEAACYYAQLAGPLQDVACLDGKTGREVVAALPASDPLRKQLAGPPPWPGGRIKARPSQPVPAAPLRRRSVLPIDGPRDPFFAGVTVSLDQHGTQAIVGHDRYGAECFHRPLQPPDPAGNAVLRNIRTCQGAVRDHLLIISTGDEVLAVDTLSGNAPARQSVLWQHSVTQLIPGGRYQAAARVQRHVLPGRPPRFHAEDSQGRPLGLLGPLLADAITYQLHDDLVCVEPLTGETLWLRHDVPPGSALFGDDELLFVVPPEEKGTPVEALVFSPIDGELLGQRPVARLGTAGSRITTVGRNTLDWFTGGNHSELVLQDIWARSVVWSRRFACGAKTWLVDNDAIAVMEPAGRFVLLTLASGQPTIDAQLEPEPRLVAIYVIAAKDQVLLIVSEPIQGQKNRIVSPVAGDLSATVVSGRIYAFERHTGKLQWPAPARIQEQGLWLTQPSELPVLAFAQQVVERDSNRRGRTTLSVLCLDRRTGQLVYYESYPRRPSDTLELVGDPNQRRVTLTTAARHVTLSLSDEPIPPSPPFDGNLDNTAMGDPGKKLLEVIGAIPRAIAEIVEGLDENAAGDPSADPLSDDDEGASEGPDADGRRNDND